MSARTGRRLALCGVLVASLAGPEAQAGTVSGRVVAFPTGQGLPGVQVLARDPQGASAAGLTDGDGRFSIEDVDPGEVRVQARPPDSMNRLGAYAGDVSAFCAADVHRLDEALADVQIELPPGGTLQGVLRDGAGSPAPGLVTAVGVDTLNIGLTRRSEASPDGEYAVLGLASWIDGSGEVLPGAYRVSAALDGEPAFHSPGVWSSQEAQLVPVVREQVTALELARPEGARLTGRVLGPSGDAVAEAPVAVVAAGFGVVWTGSSGTDGGWEAADVPGDGLTVRVRAPGLLETWSGGAWAEAGATRFAGGGEWDTGALVPVPARGVQLALRGEAESFSGSATLTLEADTPLRTDVVTFTDGLAWVDGLPPIDLTAVLRIDGWRDLALAVPQGVASIDASPVVAVSTEAVVWDRTGARPLRGALVEAVDPATGDLIGATRSDGEGRAVLAGLPQGEVLLVASWQPFCPGDRARVAVWSGATRSEPFASLVPTGTSAEVRFALPPDGDADGMDDVWELLYGLDRRRNDGAADPDGDGVTSRDEYLTYADPLLPEGQTIGCSVSGTDPTCGASVSVLALVLLLGGVVRRGRDR